MSQRFLITGGAGFIGSAVVRHLIANTPHDVFVLDKLTYAGNLENLATVACDPRYRFMQADISDSRDVREAIASFQPNILMHLAAESHVDRSIDEPSQFIQTNVVGTFTLLEAALGYWRTLNRHSRARFRFHHVSTDEVFGSLGPEGFFTESTPYSPNSPYSASKASSDHLVRAWHHTFGLPAVISNCSNNYGPFHFPEKFIPLVIIKALQREPIPVYGDGSNTRDWLYVDDHARALEVIAQVGRLGESYNVGGRTERTNIAVARLICALVDECAPDSFGPREELIQLVEDRPGHDARYAIDAGKVERELGWSPIETFESGLRKTVIWFLENTTWWQRIASTRYKGTRLGTRA